MKVLRILSFVFFVAIVLGFSGCSTDDNTPVTPTGGSGPSIPSNPSPSNNATNVSPSFITLTWTSTDPDPNDVVRFRVYFDVANPPTNVLANDITNSAADVGGVQPGSVFYWQVVANANGDTVTGPVWKFTTSP